MRNVTATVSKSTGNVTMTIKTRLAQKDILICVGVFDALSALVAEQSGFEAAFVSGSAVAYSQLARPDIGLATLTEMALAVERIRDRVDTHLLVDADSGFGNVFNVQRSVRTLERAGANGIQLEDQENTKRARDVTRRPVVSQQAMVGKVKAALDARQNDTTLISARTDAAFTLGVDEALERADSFLNAGADMVFVEGLSDPSDIQRVTQLSEGRAPVLYNLLDQNQYSASELQSWGISMVLYPSILIDSMANGARLAATNLANRVGLSDRKTVKHQVISQIIDAADYLDQGSAYDLARDLDNKN